jgi:nucleoside-diphosphate-sugar epimerase
METTMTTPANISHCLVTGGAGFLGSNLARALLDKGHHVHVFDLQAPAFTHPHLTHTVGDITQQEDVNQAFNRPIDTVFHTAAIICLMGGKAATPAYRNTAYAINVEGTNNIIKVCLKNGVSKLVYTSSNNVVFPAHPTLTWARPPLMPAMFTTCIPKPRLLPKSGAGRQWPRPVTNMCHQACRYLRPRKQLHVECPD